MHCLIHSGPWSVSSAGHFETPLNLVTGADARLKFLGRLAIILGLVAIFANPVPGAVQAVLVVALLVLALFLARLAEQHETLRVSLDAEGLARLKDAQGTVLLNGMLDHACWFAGPYAVIRLRSRASRRVRFLLISRSRQVGEDYRRLRVILLNRPAPE